MSIFKQTNVYPIFFLKLLFESVPASYAAIFFSQSRGLGISVLITTFLYPLHGLCGLLGVLFSNTWAYLLGTDRPSIRKGLFGLNGVLVGLAAGSFYALNTQLLVLLLLATLLLTLVTIFLNYLSQLYLGLPALSMPFNITAWMMMLAGIALGHLAPAQNFPLIELHLPLSEAVAAFLSAFSSILFQSNSLSGLLIALTVLFYSRIAFALMAAGLLAASLIHNLLGLDAGNMTINVLGFNYMFAALAIGGVFVIPCGASLLLGLLASAVAVIITIACDTLFSVPFSPLALPFNITIYIFLYALHHRVHISTAITLSENSALSPEENLRRHYAMRKQWKTPVTVAFPFYGRWKVTQGIDGAFTHKENWRFAFDFQAVDSAGKFYRGDGALISDHYAFGLPTLAPASGKIYSLMNDLPDNFIGQPNLKDNWGNYVIIEHTTGFYSCTAHLAQGSIKVIVGQAVKKGEVIASCGNSGRSPYPHIHFQFQHSPFLGSSTINFEFSHLVIGNQQETYLTRGIVNEGDLVRNITPAVKPSEFFPYALNKIWNFSCVNGQEEQSECWRMDIDFLGNTILESLPKGTKLYFHLSDGTLHVQSVEGDRTTGLALLGSLLSEIPFATENETLIWTTHDLVGHRVTPLLRSAMEILSLLGFHLTVVRNYTTKSGCDAIELKIKSFLQMNIPFLVIPIKKLQDVEMIFKRKIGLASLKTGDRTMNIKQID